MTIPKKEPILDAKPIRPLLQKEIEKGQTLKELGELVGLSGGTLSDIARGKKATLTLTQADKILIWLDTPLELLYPYDEGKT